MTEIAAAFGQVWTPATFVADVVGAIALGLTSGPVAVWLMPHVPARRLGVVAGGFLALAGAVFWLGQGVAAYYDGDSGWPRIVNRSAVWFVFSVVLGLAVWLRVRRVAAAHLRDLHDQAAAEVDEHIRTGRFRKGSR